MTDRLTRLTDGMRRNGLAAVAIMPGASLRYLTGLEFALSKRLTLAFFPESGEPAMVLPAMEAGRASANSMVPLRMYPWDDAEGPYHALQRCVDDLGLAGMRLGVEYTVLRVMELRALEASAPGVKVEDSTPLIAELRSVKDESELAAMAEAVRMIETSLEAIIPQIKVGVTERQLAEIWKREIAATGSEGLAFDIAVASGPNGANPHNNNSDRAFQPGDLIVLDGGAIYGGYLSDITRTVALGEPSKQARRIYELVRAANEAGRTACRPGATGEQIDAAARKVIVDGGYGEYFLHRTGHGLGIEIHEPPYIVGGSTDPLPIGATFTVEPGIYVAGVCGVRIEDDMAITADGARTLTSFPRELMVLPTDG